MEDSTVSSCKSVLDIVIAHAKSMVADEVALHLGVQRDVAIIADEFEMIRSFLMTGDKHQDPGWVKQVRDLAYDVEEGLECFAVKVGQLEKPSRWRIPRILCERRRAALEVKALLARVADQAFVSKRSLYSRLVKSSARADADPAIQVQAVAEQSGIFSAIAAIDQARRAAAAGANGSKVELHRLIDDGVKDLRVIVVWGTSLHLDKTPAVMEAYDGGDGCGTRTTFGCRAWVKLSCRSSQDEILRDLVSQLCGCADGDRDQYAFAELEEMVSQLASDHNQALYLFHYKVTAETPPLTYQSNYNLYFCKFVLFLKFRWVMSESVATLWSLQNI
ncbi:hypothetical protein HU200_066139 [Digitaria exilis]|uniref:Disease resistance N-terminal domain-containing protein n=1 Tax=Digitaria exilis TaxID=1010633 RepID=A0A835DXA3_9POAL|nr:hypothetical protein HU200_066139 [Digitaria exilis]